MRLFRRIMNYSTIRSSPTGIPALHPAKNVTLQLGGYSGLLRCFIQAVQAACHHCILSRCLLYGALLRRHFIALPQSAAGGIWFYCGGLRYAACLSYFCAPFGHFRVPRTPFPREKWPGAPGATSCQDILPNCKILPDCWIVTFYNFDFRISFLRFLWLSGIIQVLTR